MSKLLVILLLSVSVGNIFMTNAEHGESKKNSYKVYPLILFWTSDESIDKLQRPVEFTVGNAPLALYKKYNFTAAGTIKQELLFCPSIKEDKDKTDRAQKDAEKDGIAAVPIDNYRLVEIKESYVAEFIKLIRLRMDLVKCHSEPKPFISKIFSDTLTSQEDNNHSLKMIPCGPHGGTGEQYRYGYEIFINKEIFDKVKNNLDSGLTISEEYPDGGVINYEIYRFCFDRKNKKVIYTQHKLLSPRILAHRHLWRERNEDYDISTENFKLAEFNYFAQREKEYSEYLKEKVIKETSNEDSESMESPPTAPAPRPNYETEQLVPAGDFGFALWRKPTYHYVNVELMNTKLSKLWGDILKTIQTHAAKNWLEFDIYTRTFNVSKNLKGENIKHEDFDIVLGDEHMTVLKPPQIWIKIVHQFSKTISRALVIIVNNYRTEALNSDIYKLCDTDYCKYFKNENEEYHEENRYVRCCSLNNEIQQLFNLDLELNIEEGRVSSLILVEGLINTSNTSSDLKEATEAEIETEIKTEDET